MSFIVITIFLLSKRGSGSDEIHHKIIKATTYLDIEHLGNGANYEEGYSPSKPSSGAGLSQKLKNVYLSTFPRVYTFLENILNLDSFDMFRSVVIRSSDIYNVDVQPEGEIQLFINLHPLNDIRYLNQYFITLNKKLMQGGVFVGRFEPIKFRHKRFLDSYPYYLAQFFYFFDFIIRRVLPKLPVFKKIYFAITKGKNRAIPLAEGLGRLYYCGYEIIDVKEIDNYIFFAAKRMRVPATDSNPSYGLLFKMKRIGKDGKNLFVYKFRTMHPYSEYLQKFIYEKFSLQEGGKIKNDFRITSWGRIIRKLWIDELPMLLNWLKGELKLVGVRPLSSHYMSLYPQDLIQLRTKYKPGLVPPFYVDLPKTLDEIVASEKKYLNLYEQNPLLTDIKYFFKSFYNILIKNARSN
jgi:lipopolysaccharide/colanic/teichoic acid biosynthesis glycosyltransferase